ncbi:MAG TPA: hypothetical protein VF691_22515, partial [Cytophagaceae bacterium]
DAANPGNFETFDKNRLANAVTDTGINFIGLKQEQREKFKDASYNTILEYGYKLSSFDRIEEYSQNIAIYFVRLALEFTGQDTTIDRQQALASQIKDVVKITLASDTALLGDTNVFIEASQLREIPRQNIIYMKMKIREDGMEWAVSENRNGEVESRLLPE